MKLLLFLLLLISSVAPAQRPLGLSTDKTVALIFPFPIQHVDRGTKDVIVQPVKENEKILLVKAAVKQFAETNLSVVTNDGHVYAFTVTYTARPDTLVLELPVFTTASIETYARSIADNKGIVRNITDKNWSVEAAVTGIYVREDVLYFQMQFYNNSAINFDVEVLRFYLRDKKKGKRTAAQEVACTPLFIAGNPRQVKAYGSSVLVVALDKFTIPDAKFLGVQVMEKNGGRHLQLNVSNKAIVKAVALPEMQ
jgi:hypothetical protein